LFDYNWMGLLQALLVLVVGILAARIAGRAAARAVQGHMGVHEATLIRRLVFYVITALVVATALHQLGFRLGVEPVVELIPITVPLSLLFAARTSVVLFPLLTLVLWRVVNSPFGRVLQAIRQNEMRAGFVGYDVWRIKWLAFVVSAAFAGLAGGLFAWRRKVHIPT
jgi:branched-chain amino acid transport system permease protein